MTGTLKRDLALARGHGDMLADARAANLLDAAPTAGLSLVLLAAVLGAAFLWARGAVLDEVTVGHGRVVPSSREQVVQSLEGGILAELRVREGDTVAEGEVLLRIDDTKFGSSLREGRSRQQSLRAAIARLRAEVEGGEPSMPSDLPRSVTLPERELFATRRKALEEAVGALQRSLSLAERELALTAPLVAEGVVSEVEVLRLRRQVNELRGSLNDRRNSFRAEAQGALAEKEAELARVEEINAAREDQLRRTVVRAPMRGTVKNVRVTTIGGVIQPGMDIMEIVPLEDQLVIEARIRPSDVAFLRPGLPAVVKVTAYDFSIYGGLEGVLEHISADTIADERNPDESFYRIRVRTERSHLAGAEGPLPIIPGMTATVEILTGQKTVLDYLLKPVLKVRERALRER